MYNRIKYADSQHGDKFDIICQMRKDCYPKELTFEDNPKDVGVTEMKQDHYRNTGQVIMMDKEWDCFKNNYNDYVA
jgi:hypothetical protein